MPTPKIGSLSSLDFSPPDQKPEVERPGAWNFNFADIPGSAVELVKSVKELFDHTLGVPFKAVDDFVATQTGFRPGSLLDIPLTVAGGVANVGLGAVGKAMEAISIPAQNVQAWINERNLEAYLRDPKGKPFLDFNPGVLLPFNPLPIADALFGKSSKAEDIILPEYRDMIGKKPLSEIAWQMLRDGKSMGDDMVKNLAYTMLVDPLLFVPGSAWKAAAKVVTAPFSRLFMAAGGVLGGAKAFTPPVVEGYLRAIGRGKYATLTDTVSAASPKAAASVADSLGIYAGYRGGKGLSEYLTGLITKKEPRAPERLAHLAGKPLEEIPIEPWALLDPTEISSYGAAHEEAQRVARVISDPEIRQNAIDALERAERQTRVTTLPRLVHDIENVFNTQAGKEIAAVVPGIDNTTAWAAVAIRRASGNSLTIEKAVDVARDFVRRTGAAKKPEELYILHNAQFGASIGALADFVTKYDGVQLSKNVIIDLNRMNLISDRTLTGERAREIIYAASVVLSRKLPPTNEEIQRFVEVVLKTDGVDAVLKNQLEDLADLFVDRKLLRSVAREVRAHVKKLAGPRYANLPYTVTRHMSKITSLAEKNPESIYSKLRDDILAWEADWGQSGYHIGVVPPDPRQVTGSIFTPVSWAFAYKQPIRDPGPLREFIDLVKAIPNFRAHFEYRENLTKMLLESGISRDSAAPIADAIFNNLNRIARRAQAQGPIGLTYDEAEEAIRKVLSDTQYEDLVRVAGKGRMDPRYVALKAWVASARNVGLIPAAVQRTKAHSHPWLAQMTNRMYPSYRFIGDPFFQLQEWLEAYFWPALMRGPKDLGKKPDVNHILLGQRAMQRGDMDIMFEPLGGSFVWGQDELRKIGFIPLPDIKLAKDREMYLDFFRQHAEAVERFIKNSPQAGAGAWDAYMQTYGHLKTPVERVTEYMRERIELANNPVEVTRRVTKEGMRLGFLGSDAEKTTWHALIWLIDGPAKKAFETQYFGAARGLLNRSLNHPFLGIYPLSYFWKVTKRFAEALFYGPFGIDRPLYGYGAYQRVQQAIIGELNANPDGELAKAINEDFANSLFAFDMLLPAEPGNIPYHVPGWLRHIAQLHRGDRPVNGLADFVKREFEANVFGYGPIRSAVMGAQVLEELPDLGQIIHSMFLSQTNWDHQKTVDMEASLFDTVKSVTNRVGQP